MEKEAGGVEATISKCRKLFASAHSARFAERKDPQIFGKAQKAERAGF